MDIVFKNAEQVLYKYCYQNRGKNTLKIFKDSTSSLIAAMSDNMKVSSLKFIQFDGSTSSLGKADGSTKIVFADKTFYTYIILSLKALENLFKGQEYGAQTISVIRHELAHINVYETIINKFGLEFVDKYCDDNFDSKQASLSEIATYIGFNTWSEYYAYRLTKRENVSQKDYDQLLYKLKTLSSYNVTYLTNATITDRELFIKSHINDYTAFSYYIAMIYGRRHFGNPSDMISNMPELKTSPILKEYTTTIYKSLTTSWAHYPTQITVNDLYNIGYAVLSIIQEPISNGREG